MLRIETMTLNQVVARLRALGIRTTELKVEAALQRGVYPWGVCVPGEKHGCYEIYTKPLDQRVAAPATHVASRVHHHTRRRF